MLINHRVNRKSIFLFLLIVNLTSVSLKAQDQLNFEGFEEKLDKYLSPLQAVGEFSGNVLVAHKGEVKFHKGYGWASRRFGISNDLDTKFRIASMSKSFTAICILQMIEQKKLSLEDGISKYIDFPQGHAIMIKHLLSHSSGLRRDIAFPEENRTYRLEELVKMSTLDSLLFQPGTRTFYSNRNYILLQAILEQVSGLDFETYVTQYVLTPLKLNDTGVEHPMSPPVNLADGFGPGVDKNGNFEVQETQLISFGYPDGVTGLYSTTGDMLKFCSALGKSSILKPETWKLAFSPVVKESPFYNWGLGFTILGSEEAPVLNHNGKTTGFTGGYFHDLKEEFTVIILGNNSEAARSSIINSIQAILEGKEIYTPQVYNSVEMNGKDLKKFVGEYKTPDFNFIISEDNGRLYVKSHGDAPSSLSPFRTNSFFSDFFDLKLNFNVINGVVNECEWVFRNESVIARRVK